VGNARGCFVKELEAEQAAGRDEYQLFCRCAEQQSGKTGLVYVYNKFEHLYGGRNYPGRLYGCLIGRLRPTED